MLATQRQDILLKKLRSLGCGTMHPEPPERGSPLMAMRTPPGTQHCQEEARQTVTTCQGSISLSHMLFLTYELFWNIPFTFKNFHFFKNIYAFLIGTEYTYVLTVCSMAFHCTHTVWDGQVRLTAIHTTSIISPFFGWEH